MNVIPIASSSSGNAYVVEHDGFSILVDCGVPYCRLKGRDYGAVLVTHDHVDHISGLKTFLNKQDVPIFANAMTASAAASRLGIAEDVFVCFENGQDFEIGPFSVHPFSIPHDTPDPVGYVISAGGTTYFHGTDIGTPLDSVGLQLALADIATLESNHDRVMLWSSLRPPSLKQRIGGPRGHLSNDDAAELVRKFASARLKKLFLAHLSHECNAPHLALAAMREALKSMKREDIEVEVLG